MAGVDSVVAVSFAMVVVEVDPESVFPVAVVAAPELDASVGSVTPFSLALSALPASLDDEAASAEGPSLDSASLPEDGVV